MALSSLYRALFETRSFRGLVMTYHVSDLHRQTDANTKVRSKNFPHTKPFRQLDQMLDIFQPHVSVCKRVIETN